MELLTSPRTMRHAALASGLTTIACLPQLLIWRQSPYPVWFSATVIALTSTVMWAFVVAWEETRLGRAPFSMPRAPRLWQAATGFGLTIALYRLLVQDPALLASGLGERPATASQWLAAGLFQLAYLQLFLLFAPVAVASRLVRDRRVAIGLVVLLGLYVAWRSVLRSGADASTALVLQALLGRALGDGVAAWFYLRGGVLVAWWMAAIVHSRHLLALAG